MPSTHDHHLPQFHLRLPRGYLNDPNGPIELSGVVHLYFQSRSRADLNVPVEWGHAVSTDLVHWRLGRPAISPVPGGPDSDGCWSGNTVECDGQVRAYYSGKVDANDFQSILMAVSGDGGGSFGPPCQVVADPDPDEAITMFRDPFVWKASDGWQMVVGAGGPATTASVRHYTSEDGITWAYQGVLAAVPRGIVEEHDTGEGWECPQLLNVAGTEVAIVGAWSASTDAGAVFAFTVDRCPRMHTVDQGHNFYAASAMRDSTWGPVLFGWVTEGRDSGWWQQEGWAGAISLPRRAWLAGDRLATEPHPAVDSLRIGAPRPADRALITGQAEVCVPQAEKGRVRLRFGDEEFCDLLMDPDEDTVALDREHASTDNRADTSPARITHAFSQESTRPALRVLLDGSVLEVFTSSGRSLTSRVYPIAPPPWSVEGPSSAKVWDLGTTVTAVTGPTVTA